MTEKTFNEAKKILNRIERIDSFCSDVWYSPYITKGKDERNGNYLSWVDDEIGSLRNLIVGWCDKEKEKLRKELEEL